MALIDDLIARIDALEARVKSLPTGLNFRGPFKDGQEYCKGDLAVFSGSLWYCDKATAARPNDSQSDAWTLCAKQRERRAMSGRIDHDDADVTVEAIVGMIDAELHRMFPDPAKIMTAENGLALYMYFAERIDALEKRVAELQRESAA